MSRFVIPFSNGTEAMTWEANNCDRCKIRSCYSKKALQLGYVTGHITWNTAKFIGFRNCSSCQTEGESLKEYCKLNDKCDHFNIPIIRTQPVKHREIKGQFTLNI